MPSKARRAFDKNCADIERLLKIHGDLSGAAPGRKWGVEVLNKSGVILLCAFWEAYCEDIAAEGLAHLVKHATAYDSLPLELQKRIAREIREDKNELAVWALASEGWREVLGGRLASLQEQRNRQLNTPTSANIDQLFSTALGLENLSAQWRWPKLPATRSRDKLDRFVALRGDIAHRGAASTTVQKKQVSDALEHIRRLVSRTGSRVNVHVTKPTGKKLW